MPLHIYSDVYASGSVPSNWLLHKGGAIKYPVRNAAVRRYLRQLLPGQWKEKGHQNGNIGEVHYVEHESGKAAGVKFSRNLALNEQRDSSFDAVIPDE